MASVLPVPSLFPLQEDKEQQDGCSKSIAVRCAWNEPMTATLDPAPTPAHVSVRSVPDPMPLHEGYDDPPYSESQSPQAGTSTCASETPSSGSYGGLSESDVLAHRAMYRVLSEELVPSDLDALQTLIRAFDNGTVPLDGPHGLLHRFETILFAEQMDVERYTFRRTLAWQFEKVCRALCA